MFEPSGTTPMSIRRRPLAGLLALNAVLIGVLATVTLGPRVQATSNAVGRSSYTMVTGGVKGQQMPVLYIVDEGAQELVGVAWDEQQKSLTGTGYRNLATDIAEIGRARN
jgi:hypothetical protein